MKQNEKRSPLTKAIIICFVASAISLMLFFDFDIIYPNILNISLDSAVVFYEISFSFAVIFFGMAIILLIVQKIVHNIKRYNYRKE